MEVRAPEGPYLTCPARTSRPPSKQLYKKDSESNRSLPEACRVPDQRRSITDQRREITVLCQCRVPDRRRRVIWSETDPTTRNPDRRRSPHPCKKEEETKTEESNVWSLHHLPDFGLHAAGLAVTSTTDAGLVLSFPTGVTSLESLDSLDHLSTSRTHSVHTLKLKEVGRQGK